MAAFESIKGSPVAALKHDLRERESYQNDDIDQARSHLNYTISPKEHGRTTKTCMEYYEQITRDVYHRGRGTITTAQWVVTAPKELPLEREEEFFRRTYDFINDFLFGGDDTRCLLAQVHRDESRIGSSHMHYIMVLPEMENRKYMPMKDKLIEGIRKTQERFGRKFSKEEVSEVYKIVQRYEQSSLKSRERYAIHDIGETLGLKRDDARWVFTKVRRLESERYEKRLMSKDAFMTKETFSRFHPEYQRWMDEHGFECSVYKGGTGINVSVEQLKEMTRETGYQLVDRKEYARLKEHVEELEAALQEKERLVDWRANEPDPQDWGKEALWGRE